MFKPTKGPWEIIQYSCGAEIICRQYDNTGREYGLPDKIASVVSDRYNDEMGNANARLIATAPEMYSLLKEFESNYPTDERLTALLDKIEGA